MSNIPDQISAIYLDNFLVLVGLVPLYWDHFLTFDDELRYFWRRPLSKASYCFFFPRYLALIGNSPLWIINASDYGMNFCTAFGVYHQIILMVTQVVVGILMGLRVYALFGCRRSIAIYLVILCIILTGIAGWRVAASHAEYEGLDCTLTISDGAPVAIAWECVFAWDLNILCMTLWKSYTAQYFQGVKMEIPLINLMVRDGAIYFAAMMVANAANCVTFYVAPPRAIGSLSIFASAVSVSMISRLAINLNKEAGTSMEATTTVQDGSGIAFNSFNPARSGTDIGG